jgi:arabinoxylan arabinofuranohydrolase
MGFKYFDCEGVQSFAIETRGYGNGTFQVKTAWDGDVLAVIPIAFTDQWERYETKLSLPDGIHAIYLTYTGGGHTALKSICFGK